MAAERFASETIRTVVVIILAVSAKPPAVQ
jgi:hypothetical protein